MKLTVKCFATLSVLTPPTRPYEWQAEGSVNELMAHLGIPAAEVKLIFVNGLSVEGTHILTEGDRVGLFPPVGGG